MTTSLTTFLSTDRSRVALFQRSALGAVIFAHGAQKLFGWFGGPGLDGIMAYFHSLGVPAPLGFLVVMAETAGALALIAGLATRLSAAGVVAAMVGAIALVHAPNGFFMNWFGSKPGEGYEYHLLALALALPLVITGGGALSLDGWLARRTAALAPAQPHTAALAARS